MKRYLIVVVLLAAVALAIAWQWTPLGDWLTLTRLGEWARVVRDQEFTSLLVAGAYVMASLLMLPVNLLVFVTVLTFGTWAGAGYAFLGSLAAASFTFGLGRILGRDRVGYLSSSWMERLSRRFAKQGVVAMATIRLLPLAPFGIVNMVAGASHVRFRDFALGSLIGMTPVIIAIVVFGHRLQRAILDPGAASILILVAVCITLAAGFFVLRRKLS